MPTPRNELVALLARIDQKIEFAYDVGRDGSLETHELFKLCDLIDHLKESQQRAEALMRANE